MKLTVCFGFADSQFVVRGSLGGGSFASHSPARSGSVDRTGQKHETIGGL
jgi:hypothetical protein